MEFGFKYLLMIELQQCESSDMAGYNNELYTVLLFKVF